MKNSVIIGSCLSLGMLYSVSAHAQQVTLKVKEAPPEKVFKEISTQTGYQFIYAKEQIAQMKLITIDVQKKSLKEVLALVFAQQKFTYTVSDKTIAIKAITHGTEKSVVVKISNSRLHVRGVVVDENNNPIQGVSVVEIEQPEIATITNKKGEFTIYIKPKSSVSFSYVGYEREVRSSLEDKEIKVSLSPTERALKEVIVTGMYTRPRESFTGAVTTITAQELKSFAPQNPLAALQLLDPAFQIVTDITNGSNPNQLPEIRMRGQNNFPVQSDRNQNSTLNALYGNNPNQPLFIMDGFEIPLQTLIDMDMNRIARISLLKDASATAIYGSRGSNGVVVIETLQPKPGQIQIRYTGNMGVNVPDLTSYNLLNAKDKLYLEQLAGVYDVSNTRAAEYRAYVSGLYNEYLKEVERGVDTYWLSQPLKTAISQSHTLGVYGGEQAMRYDLSLNYKNTQGVMIGNNRNNYSGNLNLNYVKGKLSISNNISINFNKGNESPYGKFGDYARLNPYLRPYGPDGLPVRIFMDYDLLASGNNYRVENPLYTASQNPINSTSYNQIIENLRLNYQILPWLRLSGQVSFTHANTQGDDFRPNTLPEFDKLPFEQRGQYTLTNGKNYNLQNSLALDISKSFGKHQLFFTINGQMIESKVESYTQTATGFTNRRMTNFIFGNQYKQGTAPNGTQGISRMVSLNNFLTYTYDNRYYTNFSYAGTGSSQFGADQRFGNFWSIGAGWNLHEEGFLKGNKTINTLRLRASAGPTGNQNFPPYQGITTYRYINGANYRGLLGADLLGYGNRDLKWQSNFKENIGVDLNMFSGRINLAADLYQEKTKDLILGLNTPPSVGFTSYSANKGRMRNRGVDLRLNVGVIRSLEKNMSWNIGFNATSINNKILEIYPMPTNQNPTQQQLRDNARYVVGGSINDVWVIPSMGIDPATGQEMFQMPDGHYTFEPNAAYQLPLGNSVAKWQGSIYSSFQYKGWTLTVGTLFRRGARIINSTLQDRVEVSSYRDNVDQRVLDQRWLKPGDVTRYVALVPAGRVGSSPNVYRYSSRFLQLENVLDVQSVSLAYRLPEKLTKKWNMSNTSITAYANNPFYLSTISQERGLDTPFQRVYTLQISTTLF